MACGLPVIASDVAGVREVVGESSGTGFLVPPTDYPQFAARLKELLADPELRSEMGEAARNRAHLFDARHTIVGYVRLYQDTIGNLSAPCATDGEIPAGY
jgi:glycosyltransferase involved in cell wall biosynthesis